MSNKTLKENAKKTKLAPKYRGVIIVALVTALAVCLLTTIRLEDKACANGLYVANQCYSLERATTDAEQAKGLSDRDNLAPQAAMLFSFSGNDEECIWMKDMRFSLDILWLDNNKKVTRIEQNVRPETYPNTFCQDKTKYVFELNVGDVQKLGIQTGQQLVF